MNNANPTTLEPNIMSQTEPKSHSITVTNTPIPHLATHPLGLSRPRSTPLDPHKPYSPSANSALGTLQSRCRRESRPHFSSRTTPFPAHNHSPPIHTPSKLHHHHPASYSNLPSPSHTPACDGTLTPPSLNPPCKNQQAPSR